LQQVRCGGGNVGFKHQDHLRRDAVGAIRCCRPARRERPSGYYGSSALNAASASSKAGAENGRALNVCGV
jgi:hypothetical protein